MLDSSTRIIKALQFLPTHFQIWGVKILIEFAAVTFLP